MHLYRQIGQYNRSPDFVPACGGFGTLRVVLLFTTVRRSQNAVGPGIILLKG